jgi:predicted permease
MNRLLRRLMLLLRRRRAMAELDEEMRLHVELRATANRRRGLTAEDAARAARRRFGNHLRLREQGLDMWGFAGLDRFSKDVRYACRQLIRHKVWTASVVSTLALGVGANTAIFTLLDAMLIRPAPGPHPNTLVWIASLSGPGGAVRTVSYPDYVAVRDETTTLSSVLAYGGTEFSIGGEHAERVFGSVVSGNYFDVLGIRPALGRTFTRDEDVTPGAHPVAVLSDALWKTRFGADRHVVGSVALINGRPFTIVGVAAPGFVGVELGENAEIWVPLAMQNEAMPTHPGLLTLPNAGWLRVVGRLRDGESVARADAEMRVLAARLVPPNTPPERQKSAAVTPIHGGLNPSNRSVLAPIFGLIAIVPALVLLVACANVANVLMARNVGRRKEFAMRRAIGATRGRLIQQLLTECLMLGILAAAAGFLASFGLKGLIDHFGEIPAEVSATLSPDLRVLAATLALAMLTSLVFGLAPAVTATRFALLPALKEDGSTSTAGGGRTRVRSAFVVAQMTLALAVLITAGLFLRSLSKASRVDPGFDPHGAVTLSFDPDLQGYSPARRDLLVGQLIDRASALPGVAAAAVTSALPLSGLMASSDLIADGTKTPVAAMLSSISPRYFQAMRIDILKGRDLAPSDVPDGPPVVVINEALAHRLWPDADPIGRRLRLDDPGERWREVIAVVRDGKYGHLTEPQLAAAFLPWRQRPAGPVSLVVRASGEPQVVLSTAVEAIHGLDRDLPLYRVESLEETLRQIVNLQRAAASLLGVFGGLTLLLAAVGIYGVVAHGVSLRTREVGIRMSLGARPGDVLRLFVREALRLALIGIAMGLVISAAASRLLTTLLFGLAPIDAVTFVSGTGILCAVAVLAAYVPARLAARVNPLVALRHD